MARRLLPLIPLAALAACASHKPGVSTAPSTTRAAPAGGADFHVPDFARKPYEPFARDAVVAIALREWRLFDKPVDDDPPGTRPPPLPEDKPEREQGLWQRVGEYWWLGIDADEPEAAWTGKHDEYGNVFPADVDARFAWSAAFVSYVMRSAGAGSRFPYAINHSDYINAGKEMALGQAAGWVMTAERPETYAPQPGDLICHGRGRAGRLTYDDLPAGHFAGHCDIVVLLQPNQLSVIGGNVDDAVTMKHIPVTADGKLATPDGTILDTRYPWMVVLRIQYDAPVS